MSVLPDGPYLLRVVDVGAERTPPKGTFSRKPVTLELLGTDYKIWWWVSSSPRTTWQWEDVVPSYEELDQLHDRIFLFNVGQEQQLNPGSAKRYLMNRVTAPLAEYFPDDA